MKTWEMEREALLALLPAAIARICAGKPRRCIPRREDDDDAVVERALELLRSARAEGEDLASAWLFVRRQIVESLDWPKREPPHLRDAVARLDALLALTPEVPHAAQR